MKIKGKTFVVTGAGGGLGRELTLQLIAKGAAVAAVDYNPDALQGTSRRIPEGRDYSLHEVDISNREQVAALPEAVISSHGQVDALINNAGVIHSFSPMWELPLTEMERVFDINWWGTVYMIRAFLPHFLQRPAGHITNISSMGGFMPVPKQSIYGASKAAVKIMTEGLLQELADTKVGVSLVYPGGIDTDIVDNAPGIMEGEKNRINAMKKGSNIASQPADAAATIIKGIKSNSARILVGHDSRLMDKLYRISPTSTTKVVGYAMNKLDFSE